MGRASGLPEILDVVGRHRETRWNGEVHPCDLWGQTGIGDFNKQSFEEIWTSPDYVRLRWDHVRRLPSHPKCRKCTMVTTDNLEGKAKSMRLSGAPNRDRGPSRASSHITVHTDHVHGGLV
jgi:radical SAM protein with 4Fe4S-binding SPASM domain